MISGSSPHHNLKKGFIVSTKHERIIQLLDKHNLDGLLIHQISNFAWATDGAASYINTAATNGVATLFVTRDSRHLISDNIESPRFEIEEHLKDQGWEFHTHRWDQPADALAELTRGCRIGVDGAFPGAVDLSGELAVFRSYLDFAEQDRFRSLSALCAQAMDEAIRGVKPGMTEFQIASLLSSATQARGVLPIVNLIATDERIYHFRHPLPTDKKMEKYAMLVICGRKEGLVCSLTRFVHFGELPAELQKKAQAVAHVDAAMIAATRPGVKLNEVFQAGKAAYAEVDFPNQWHLHHQGGPAGYDPREFVATDAVNVPIGLGQVYAWNPSITGCKSEDTILVGEENNDILSAIAGWPVIPIEVNGQVILRPEILVID
jgi:antitoxin VapB